MDDVGSVRVQGVIALQEQLLSLDSDGVEDVCAFVVSRWLLGTAFEQRRLGSNILNVLDVRPLQVSVLAELCSRVCKSNESFKQCLVMLMFSEKMNCVRLAFLRKLVSLGAIPVECVLSHLSGDELFWFAPEVCARCEDELVGVDELRDNNWEMFQMLSNAFFSVDAVATAIQSDNVKAIEGVDVNYVIQPHRFVCDPLLNRPCHMLEYAAVFDAASCFDFLAQKCDVSGLVEFLTEIAISYGSNRILKKLFVLPNFNKQAALGIAASRHRNATFRYLLSQGAEITMETCVCFAVWNNIELLYENLSQIMETELFLETMVIAAAKSDRIEVVELLMQCPERCMITSEDGRIVPMFAVANNDIELLEMFTQRAPSDYITSRDSNGTNMLLLAVQLGRVDIVKYLISLNVFDVNERNDNGDVPLLAAVRTNNIEIIDILLSYSGTDLSVRGIGNTNALIEAIKANNSALIKHFLDLRVCLNEKDGSGRTPLFMAIDQNNADLVTALLQTGHDIDARDNDGVFFALRYHHSYWLQRQITSKF